MIADRKLNLLVVSHVWPFPGHAGQQQRVLNKLRAFRDHFHVTFLTFAPQNQLSTVHQRLLEHCDDAIVLSSRYRSNPAAKATHRLRGTFYALKEALKFSNYVIGRVELSAQRLQPLLEGKRFDLAVFEYWHAAELAPLLQSAGAPCVLDMHDILGHSLQRQLQKKRWIPPSLGARFVRRYRRQEEKAWQRFDAIITINAAEHEVVRKLLPDMPLRYAPMGIDMSQWSYSWQPASPPRVAYYGGLGSPHNQRDALRCYNDIMPHIWSQAPDTELWLIGSRPPQSLRSLPDRDRRVHVTGFVEDIQSILKTMTAVLCPWEGKFGFRSRLIEAMALGVPVVATPDAVYGMDLDDGAGCLLASTNASLARECLRIVRDRDEARQQSIMARRQVENKYSFQATYGALTKSLLDFCFMNVQPAFALT